MGNRHRRLRNVREASTDRLLDRYEVLVRKPLDWFGHPLGHQAEWVSLVTALRRRGVLVMGQPDCTCEECCAAWPEAAFGR